MEEIVKLQKEKDLEDIENLWKGTVENNQVIGFALKKLATPESQRRIHSSLMAKTLSAMRVDYVKAHSLYMVRGTEMARAYEAHEFEICSAEKKGARPSLSRPDSSFWFIYFSPRSMRRSSFHAGSVVRMVTRFPVLTALRPFMFES